MVELFTSQFTGLSWLKTANVGSYPLRSFLTEKKLSVYIVITVDILYVMQNQKILFMELMWYVIQP